MAFSFIFFIVIAFYVECLEIGPQTRKIFATVIIQSDMFLLKIIIWSSSTRMKRIKYIVLWIYFTALGSHKKGLTVDIPRKCFFIIIDLNLFILRSIFFELMLISNCFSFLQYSHNVLMEGLLSINKIEYFS